MVGLCDTLGAMRPSLTDVEHALLSRWPETKLEPSLDRITALCQLLGDPQAAFPVVHITGTNGKTSTSRMIDALLRSLGLRTGRFTSPHLESMTERICIDGEPIDEERFIDTFEDVNPYAQMVDDSQEFPLSFFEMITALGFAAFADAPVDAGVLEVGMGGTWDSTNVANAQVAVITPIDIDHQAYLGDTAADIAVEKAGIIKPNSRVVIAQQSEQVESVLIDHALKVGAEPYREGVDFGVLNRSVAVDGQLITLQGIYGRYEDIFLPVHGAHQAQNASVALAAVEAFAAKGEIDPKIVHEAFGAVTTPGRLEVIRTSPTVVLDAAHNPHGAQATVAGVSEAFSFSPLVGVVGVMADKDIEEMLEIFEPVFAQIVCTQNTTPRAMPADELAQIAEGIFGSDRVFLEPDMLEAVEKAVALTEQESVGSGGVLVTGSVVTVGQVRNLFK